LLAENQKAGLLIRHYCSMTAINSVATRAYQEIAKSKPEIMGQN